MSEQEKQEFFEAALRLAECAKGLKTGYVMNAEDVDSLVAAIEKHRPKPKLVEAWLRIGPFGRIGNGSATKEQAEAALPEGWKAVHVREVTSKEWERWNPFHRAGYYWITGSNPGGEPTSIAGPFNLKEVEKFCEAHNRAMEEMAK